MPDVALAFQIPVLRVPIEGAPSASRLLWTPNGQQVLVGDNSGKLHVFDVKEVREFTEYFLEDERFLEELKS